MVALVSASAPPNNLCDLFAPRTARAKSLPLVSFPTPPSTVDAILPPTIPCTANAPIDSTNPEPRDIHQAGSDKFIDCPGFSS